MLKGEPRLRVVLVINATSEALHMKRKAPAWRAPTLS